MNLLAFLHLVLAAIWLGCVLVEAVFERAGDGSNRDRVFISRAHWRVDLIVETPAFLGVFVTGALMASRVPMSPLLIAKIAFGALAIGFNVYCVWLVRERLRAAEAGDFARWERIDHAQHRYGAVVLLGIVGALILGGWLFAGS